MLSLLFLSRALTINIRIRILNKLPKLDFIGGWADSFNKCENVFFVDSP